MTFAELGAIASLVLNIGIAIVGATWGIAKIRDTVRDAMDAHRQKYDEELDLLQRNVGESIAALRQKINDVELYAANTYMRREGFHTVQTQIRDDMKDLTGQFNERFKRIEDKLDSVLSAQS